MKWRLVLLAVLCSLQSLSQKSASHLLMYYMPYDNDLGIYADTILAQLTNQSENVAVTVLLDRPGPGGLELYLDDSDMSSPDEVLDIEDSSDAEALKSLLVESTNEWMSSNQSLFFLNHAGSLNELGLDTYPDSSWLLMSAVNDVLANHVLWNGKLNFIYYQVCSKSSLEALYEHHEYYSCVMASQLILGAPNYYYKELIDQLDTRDGYVGEFGARICAEHERADMFHSLSLISPSCIWHLREQLAMLIGPSPQEPVEIPLEFVRDFQYDGLTYVDLKSLIKYLRRYKRWDRKQCREIRQLIGDIELQKGHMAPDKIDKGFSGLSICLTPRPEDMDLKFYEGAKLPFITKK